MSLHDRVKKTYRDRLPEECCENCADVDTPDDDEPWLRCKICMGLTIHECGICDEHRQIGHVRKET